MSREIPDYVEGHNLLAGKSVLITAAAGAGIGFSTARLAAEKPIPAPAAAVISTDLPANRLWPST